MFITGRRIASGFLFRHAWKVDLFERNFSHLCIGQIVVGSRGLVVASRSSKSSLASLRQNCTSVTMHRPENSDVFQYTDKDMQLSTNTWAPGSEFELSQFDLELRSRWDSAMKGGAFRYDISHIKTRIIPGPKHYVAQLNLLRAKERRKPQDIRSISQPFNNKQFNFTWVRPQELIFNLRHSASADSQSTAKPHNKSQVEKAVELEQSAEGESSGAGVSEPTLYPQSSSTTVNGTTKDQSAQNGKSCEERHALIINVSPMEYGHCLLVPQIDSCLPQVATETSLRVVLETLLLSKHRGFVLGFNSLCAFASVNHLHYHAYYLEHELVVDYCPVTQLEGPLHEITTIPVPGFAFQLHGSTVEDVSRQVHKVSTYFQESDIAHNLFICRGTVFGEDRGSTNTTIRVFIWPRRKFVGTKSAEEFNVASIELGGHLPIRELDGYHSLTEEAVDAIIADSQLPAEHYKKIKKHVVGLFSAAIPGTQHKD